MAWRRRRHYGAARRRLSTLAFLMRDVGSSWRRLPTALSAAPQCAHHAGRTQTWDAPGLRHGRDGANAVPLLAAVLAWLQEQGASAALGYFVRYSAPWHQARAAGFVCLPRLLVPRDYPVCASVRPDDPHSAELLNPAHWYMSLADSDLA